MDVLYEESAVNRKSASQQKTYNVLNVIFWIVTLIGIIAAFMFINRLLGTLSTLKVKPEKEEEQQAIYFVRTAMILWGFAFLFFGGLWGILFTVKRRLNVSYDYVFVSGELRISKVFNVNRRKFLYRIEPESIITIGDIETGNYDRIRSDPSTKELVCTPNNEAADGKFFMYIHASESTGKKLYVLECRETLLENILKFVKRGTLDSGYVPQAKKGQR